MPWRYNDYVLDTSRQMGWISEDQEKSIRLALESLPKAFAVDYMEEQQILSPQQSAEFRKIIQEAQQTQQESTSTALSSTTSAEAQHVNDYLRYCIQRGASDLHLSPTSKPIMRIAGQLQVIDDFPTLTPQDTERLAKSFLSEDQFDEVVRHGSIDFCYDVPEMNRFRTSVVRQRRGWEIVFRIINSKIRTMDELQLPPNSKF